MSETQNLFAVLRQSADAAASDAIERLVREGEDRALNRINVPQDALDQISELTSVGASLIISDQGLGPETGLETDFIVLTR